MYVAYVEYFDGEVGLVGEGFVSIDDAEEAARRTLSSEVTLEYLRHKYGGVKAVVVWESKEVRRVVL